ncbi:MAG: flagellar export protein FliJ [Oligoflexia bacterium]|nr:flagellar export protein FliJ [Oligoflexia bacterium]
MKFKFSYEKLEEYYKQQEQIASRDYNESMAHLDNEKQRYQNMFEELDVAAEDGAALRARPEGAPIARLVQIDDYIDGQKINIARQREIVINHTHIVEQKQEILIAATKESKTYEKLRENQFTAFKQKLKKHEAKVNDELVVTRFRRGGS